MEETGAARLLRHREGRWSFRDGRRRGCLAQLRCLHLGEGILLRALRNLRTLPLRDCQRCGVAQDHDPLLGVCLILLWCTPYEHFFTLSGSHPCLVEFRPADEDIYTSPYTIDVLGISSFKGWDGGSQLDDIH